MRLLSSIGICGSSAYSGDNGQASNAKLNCPREIFFDASYSNLYIADTCNHVIRILIIATNIITTKAGNGVANFGGDGGPATSSNLNSPHGGCIPVLDLRGGIAPPLGSWNVSNVTSMSSMFQEASSFNQPLDAWNVSNVTEMTYMFHEHLIISWIMFYLYNLARLYFVNLYCLLLF